MHKNSEHCGNLLLVQVVIIHTVISCEERLIKISLTFPQLKQKMAGNKQLIPQRLIISYLILLFENATASLAYDGTYLQKKIMLNSYLKILDSAEYVKM